MSVESNVPSLAEFITFVRGEEFAVLSTVDATGAPSGSLVGVAIAADGRLIVDAHRSARKVANVERDGRVAVVIGLESPTSWQIEGHATVVTGDERSAAERVYLERFPTSRTTDVDFAVISIRPRLLRRYAEDVGLTELTLT